MRLGAPALALAASLAGAASAAERGPLAVPDVPFVSQPPALCGGAALAMVARFWGLREVAPEDFASGLAADGAGIPAEFLAWRARALGLQAFAFRGEPDDVQGHLARGRPLVVLVETHPGLRHYVVLLAWTAEAVVYHDPAAGPFRIESESDFKQRWQGGANVTLLLLPSERVADAPQPSRADDEPRPVDPALERASDAFRREDWAAAARHAGDAVSRDPEDKYAWRLLATSRYLAGDRAGALEAWNAVGEPRLDLIRTDGLTRVRPRAVEESLGVRSGSVLTPDAFRLAERRLASLPAVQAGRLDLQPRPGGLADLDVALLERPARPGARSFLLGVGARALAEHALGFEQALTAKGGETILSLAQWQPERSRALLGVATPRAFGLPGLVSAQVLIDEQTYRTGPATEGASLRERRRRGGLTLENWWSADLRGSVGVALDEWDGRSAALALALGLERRLLADRLALGSRVEGFWSREHPFYTVAAFARARSRTVADRPVVALSVSQELATSRAPLALWPGAGTGPGRDALLRGRPLLHDGVVDGPAFGRSLLSGTLEVVKPLARLGPVRLCGALFSDGARVSSTGGGPGTAGVYVDSGLGLRLGLPARRSVVRLDVARSWNGAGVRVSAGWQTAVW